MLQHAISRLNEIDLQNSGDVISDALREIEPHFDKMLDAIANNQERYDCNLTDTNQSKYIRTARRIVREDCTKKDSIDESIIVVKFLELLSGSTAKVDDIVKCLLKLLDRCKDWWEDGQVLYVAGDQQVHRLVSEAIIVHGNDVTTEHKNLKFIFANDSDWHKLAQGGVDILRRLFPDLIQGVINLLRNGQPSRELYSKWQEADFIIQVSFEFITRIYAKKYLVERSRNNSFLRWLRETVSSKHMRFIEVCMSYLVGMDGIRLDNCDMVRTVSKLQQFMYIPITNKSLYYALSTQMDMVFSVLNPL